MRVLHLITGLTSGGSESVLLRLVQNLKGSQIENRVFCLRGRGSVGDKIAAEGIAVEYLNLPHPVAVLRLIRLIQAILWCNVCNTWLYHSGLMASVLAIFIRRPVIWNMRGALQTFNNETVGARAIVWLCAFLSKMPKMIIYNSQRAKHNHEQLGFRARNARIIHNGFPTATRDLGAKAKVCQWLGIQSTDKLILAVGRMHVDKDYPTFFAAMAKVLTQNSDLSVMVAGRNIGWERQEISSRVPESIRQRFYFLGELSELSDIYSAADLFVLTSRTESFPNVLAEAMSYGLPAISTDVGAAGEILGEREYICEIGNADQVANLTNRIIAMSGDERKRVGEANQSRIRAHYSIKKMTAEFIDCFERVR